MALPRSWNSARSKRTMRVATLAGIVLCMVLLTQPLSASSNNQLSLGRAAVLSAERTYSRRPIIPNASPPGPCKGTRVLPESNVQGVLDGSPEGTTFCFQPGTYRLENPLNPKAKQRLLGVKGAVISGAKVVGGFTAEGPNFVAAGFLPPTPSDQGFCVVTGCTYTQDVFVDGAPLPRVVNLADLAPGTFYEDFAQNKIYLRDDPTNRVVEQSYASRLISSENPQITVQDLVLEKAAGEAQSAAVMGVNGWLIQYNEARFNHGGGIDCASCVVRGNFVHHNGQLGLSGQNGIHDLVEGNEVSYNNTAGYDPLWEAGGSKWGPTLGLVLRGNYVHHNHGPGLWTDSSNHQAMIERNYVSSNDEHGIFHEISYDAKIRYNVVVDNGFHMPNDLDAWGGAGIRIAASPNVEVANNRVIGNRNGIVGIQQDRQDFPDPVGPHEISNLSVHDNDVSMSVGMSGLVQDIGDLSYFAQRGNSFQRNHYHLDSLEAQRFAWADQELTAARWKELGNDTNGTFDTVVRTAPAPPLLKVGPRVACPAARLRTKACRLQVTRLRSLATAGGGTAR